MEKKQRYDTYFSIEFGKTFNYIISRFFPTSMKKNVLCLTFDLKSGFAYFFTSFTLKKDY